MKSKTIFNGILGMLAICGLLITGGELQSTSILKQMVSCTVGVIIFSVSMFSLVYMNGEGE